MARNATKQTASKKAVAKKAAFKKAAPKKAAAKKTSRTKQPPYKCQTTLVSGKCLRFNWNPADQQYNDPPEGEEVDCTTCKYWFE
jgi:hypothetical protein